MIVRTAALAALALVWSAIAGAETTRQWIEGGPTPTRYEIAVTPNVAAGTFTGAVSIAIASEALAPQITLNALELDVQRASIDGRRAAVTLDEAAQTLTLTPRRPLAPGAHTIQITYSGVIHDEAFGLFRVSYEDDGQTKQALSTQFEPGDARRFAPMWDQPDRRAVFSLTVTAPSALLAVSNMPIETAVPAGRGLTRTRFADSPSMASYLLYLGIGDFERVTRNVDGVELGVVMRRGEGHRAKIALDAGEQTLRYYTNYFAIPYPLPKLDMVAVPGAGGFGAMENWGAILYFDQYLLADENSSEAERQNVFSIVAHEIAHQWFGNLVTMAWWDDLWLNEGFASWMAAKATDTLHPDWKPWLAQLTDGTKTAMALDARAGTHPIVRPVNTIDEANLAFDTITYQKGLAVLRMLEAYVGEDDFRDGVRAYLNAHRFSNARTEDLWRSVQAASGQPVLDIARSFTGQPGFPVLSVASAPCERQRGAPTLTLSQRRFAMDDASRTQESWPIPVVATRLGGAPVRAVLAPAATSTLDVAPACAPYLVNAGQTGFLRVLYDRADLAALQPRFATLDSADQLGLLLDYWAFARSGDASFTDYLALSEAIPADADPVIVVETIASLDALVTYARGRPSEASLKRYALDRLRPHFARVGRTPRADDSSNILQMRAELIEALAKLGDEAVIAEARRMIASPETIHGSLRNSVLSAYAINATPAEYDALIARARAATDFVEQRRLWLRIANTNDAALARRTLDLALTDTIPRQIRSQVIAGVANEHPRLAWDFVVARRAEIEPLLDPLQRLEYPADIASANVEPAIATELEAYAANFPEGARPTVAAAAGAVRLRAQTIAERMPAVEAWVGERQRAPHPGGAR